MRGIATGNKVICTRTAGTGGFFSLGEVTGRRGIAGGNKGAREREREEREERAREECGCGEREDCVGRP